MMSTPQTQALAAGVIASPPSDISSAINASSSQPPPATWTQLPAPTIRGSSSPPPSSLQGQVRDSQGTGVVGAKITLSTDGDRSYSAITDSEGIFRLRNISPGNYSLTVEKQGFLKLEREGLQVQRGAMLLTVLNLEATGGPETVPIGPAGVPGILPTASAGTPNTYPALPSAATATETTAVLQEEELAQPENFKRQPSRWDIPMPKWSRYERAHESPYSQGHWYDPFNRNRLKGDYPIFGQRWFLRLTGTSETGIDVRRVPLPSGISTAQPGESTFFGKQEQAFLGQTFRLSFDLFRGDTSYLPADFRLRFTPAVNLNFLQTRERGLVNIDVRKGINRMDAHAGLQEGFIEAKLHDVGPNFDVISVRAGIQHFNSDFRGFLFSEEQPGVRIFGNLRSNRFSYNLAYFYMLEKNTNSGLNTFEPRYQQVGIANLYIQDFLTRGYTTQFSFHYNRDDATIHFDDNDFLVRPAPIGLVVNGGIKSHAIRAYYLGWTSNGHIGGINLSHAFYQALGHDSFNTIAGRYININAQLAALELSVDKDWARFRLSSLYQSGDSANRSGSFRKDDTARGFDTIVDDTHFAGSAFSFWDSEGIRLTRVGVALTNPGSLLASLRSNKFEGQANFVNPGVFLVNAGVDFALTPKLRAFLNGNYLRFAETEPLEIVLMQRPIRHGIGTDLGAGIEYRPPLTENIVITAGTSYLVPATGFEQMLNGKTLISAFTRLKFEF
jgi:Carboxypeptidase regulatory-like domain